MSDDVRGWFEELGHVPVPAGDLGAVVSAGRVRRRRRIAARVVSLSIVALAAGVATSILSGQENRPVPATPEDRRLLESRLVPLIMEGPEPGPDLAAEEDRERARAVTVAFHALLDRAPSYDFDYLGLGRTTDGWVAEFAQVSPPSDLERALAGRRAEVASRQRELEKQLQELAAALNRAKDADRKRTTGLERHRGDIRNELRRTRTQLAGVEGRMMELGRRLPASSLMLTVSERNGFVVVEDLLGESEDSAILRGVVGYAEAVDQVDAWGADYYGLELRRVDDALLRANLRQFWTGPLHAPYEERCVPHVVGPGGEVVWTGPAAEAGYASAPATEEERDGTEIELGFGYRGDERDLVVSMVCRWRPRQ